ncbi:MAG TPA: hypothetical protein VFZ42_06715 [Chitinophagaceae bacterium]
MTQLHYLKWPLIIFLIGLSIVFIGSLWKIRHWPMGDELLTLGHITCIAAFIFGIVKLLLVKKT